MAVLAAAAITIVAVPGPRQAIFQSLERVRTWGVWGAVALGLVYIPATVLFVPGLLLTMLAGYAFGVVTGTIVISLGSTAGASAAFWIGRTLGRDWVSRRFQNSPSFAAFDRAVAGNGFWIVLLVRLSPLIPFNALNYACSLTSVRFRDYLAASWLGMLPGTLLYVYLGSTCASLADLSSTNRPSTGSERIAFYAGLAVTLVVTLLVTRAARRALTSRLEPDIDSGRRNR